jgi:glycosyltransferase involved in cell wall biosynthesis
MKKIIILTGVNPYKGSGAVVLDLHKSFIMSGCQSHIISNTFSYKVDENIIFLKSFFQSQFVRVKNRILSFFDSKKDAKYSMIDLDLSTRKLSYRKVVDKFPFKPDYIIYLFEHNFLTEEDLYHIGEITKAPIYHYMADLGPMTGGCHYFWDCEGYINKCGNCPGIYSNKENDITHHNLMFRKKYVDKTNIFAIAGSSWQHKKLLQSYVYKDKPKHKILAPIDENLFTSIDKLSARKSLGLPINKNIIYSGSVLLTKKRKGFREFVKSLNYLYEKNSTAFNDTIHVVYSGNIPKDFINDIPFSNTILPYIDYKELVMVYNAIDIFACSSLQEAGPTMINQSMMCGTPVVSFRMGVALDLIDEGVTGYLADILDIKAFAKGIQSYFLLSEKDKDKMSINCKNLALSRSSLSSCSKNFIELFKNYTL